MTVRVVAQAAGALVAAVACVLSWLAAGTTVDVAPVVPTEPATTEVVYSAPLLALSLLLATVAGVCGVLVVAGLRRRAASD